MNLAALKAAFVRLAYLALLREPDPAGEANWVALLKDDFSNVEDVIRQIEESVEGAGDLAILRALIANSRQNLASIKGLLGAL